VGSASEELAGLGVSLPDRAGGGRGAVEHGDRGRPGLYRLDGRQMAGPVSALQSHGRGAARPHRAHGHLRVERRVRILEDDLDAAAQAAQLAATERGDLGPVEDDRAAVWLDQPCQAARERGKRLLTFGFLKRSSENFTSAAVTGAPFENRASRRWKTIVLPPFDIPRTWRARAGGRRSPAGTRPAGRRSS
jgi:hypothetical protein